MFAIWPPLVGKILGKLSLTFQKEMEDTFKVGFREVGYEDGHRFASSSSRATLGEMY
jgi:hypothetical protein